MIKLIQQLINDSSESHSDDKLDQLRQERNELMSEVQDMKGDENVRTARLEEAVAEISQEVKEKDKKIEELRKRHQEDRKAGTVATPPPDSDILKGKKVISADGTKIFGDFNEFITESDKWGIKCEVPNSKVPYRKVGYADTLRELIVDPHRSSDKEVVIVKFDGDGRPIEGATEIGMRQFQDEKIRRKEAEERANRLSAENSELSEQNQRLEKLTQKLMVMASMAKGVGNGHDKDMEIHRLQRKRDVESEHMNDLATALSAKEGRTQELIQKYENGHELEGVGEPEHEKAMKMARGQSEEVMDMLSSMLQALPEEMREDLLRQGSGSITMTPESKS